MEQKPKLKTTEQLHFAICPVCLNKFYIASKKDYINKLWIKNKQQFFCSLNCKSIYDQKRYIQKNAESDIITN